MIERRKPERRGSSEQRPLFARTSGALGRLRRARYDAALRVARFRWSLPEARRIAREEGVPLAVQARRYLPYALRAGVSLVEFYHIWLWAPSAAPPHEILSWKRWTRLDRKLNPAPFRILAAHKYLAHCALEGAGVPEPRFLGLLHQRYGFAHDGSPLRSAADLRRLVEAAGVEPVFKPTRGHKGKGVLVCRAIENGRLCALDGVKLDPETLYGILVGSADEWLVQARVRPHDFFARYSEAASKARIVTLLRGGDVHVIAAAFSIAIPGQMAVNNDSGALIAGVDRSTGELLGAIQYRDARLRSHHPSGAPIRGEKVPFWSDALATAVKAQRAMPYLRCLGWDIALDEEGVWRVLEGNMGWSVRSMQFIGRQGLLAGPLAEELSPRRRREAPEAGATPRDAVGVESLQ